MSIENRLNGPSEEEPRIHRDYPTGTLCVPSVEYVIQRIKTFLGDDSHKKNWTRRVDVTTYDSDGVEDVDAVRVYFPDGTFELWSWETRPNKGHLMTLIFGEGVRSITHHHDMDVMILRDGSKNDPCGRCASFEGFRQLFQRSAPYPHRPDSTCNATVSECVACGAAHYKQGWRLQTPIPNGVVAAMKLTLSPDGYFIVSDDFNEEE